MAEALLGLGSQPLPNNKQPTRELLPKIPFKLYDDDGELYYEGILHDDDECLNQEAALSWGAADAGCTRIEVKRSGEWVQDIG